MGEWANYWSGEKASFYVEIESATSAIEARVTRTWPGAEAREEDGDDDDA